MLLNGINLRSIFTLAIGTAAEFIANGLFSSYGRWTINAVTWIANEVLFQRMALSDIGRLED
jgi:hypothetical protein